MNILRARQWQANDDNDAVAPIPPALLVPIDAPFIVEYSILQ